MVKTIDGAIEKKEQKQESALELKIAEKARTIAEILGEKYHYSDWCASLGGTEYLYTKDGFQYEDKNLKIKAYETSGKQQFIDISFNEKKERTFMFIKIPASSFKIVYFQENEKVRMFRNEDKWLYHIDGLYQVALETIQERERAKQEQEKRKAIEELENDFGILVREPRGYIRLKKIKN